MYKIVYCNKKKINKLIFFLKKNWKNYFRYVFQFYNYFYDLKKFKSKKHKASTETLEGVFKEYYEKISDGYSIRNCYINAIS